MLAAIFVALVAAEHLYILAMEMFLWTKPRTRKTFNLTPEFAEQTKSLAANQGLYNGFLAAGLIWGLVHPNADFGYQIQLFFLICVLVAALYGGLTTKRSILVMQGLPALIALLLVLFT
ncbi:hypothetical protein BBD42_06530 [Paenibacillus sp. BIHB 4019]|uniref:Epimerase n=1 Tax=Paenibacillus sp. BIHB 4019 TaxID=1870819 RepID=A0A1B2DEM2_9BACL|nr:MULTISPECIES: DUF1304 domain-containing protein [unclassified Paenibacillus]ANY66154.1 hypothetical protein BBD42_06530 [Paenibacillus sp. BIHB 4019]KQO18565.1 hypothetical protein ASF12_08180 [Paenibacillus sp. Leaf72]